MDTKKINYGFVEPVIEDSHFVLGGLLALPKNVIVPDGQWDKFLPKYEAQYGEFFDTFNCTAYGTENAIEMFQKGKYGEDRNYSERMLGIVAGTKPPGNDPQVVSDAVRKFGLVDDVELPLERANTIDEYYSPKPLTKYLADKGVEWLKQFTFGHEWVFTGKLAIEEQQKKMVEALKYSPLGVAVFAWTENDRGLYIRTGNDCHWCVIFGYAQGNYWKCFDSYDGGIKLLAWDFGFSWVKRYDLQKKSIVEEKKSIIERLIYWLTELLKVTPKDEPIAEVAPQPVPVVAPATPPEFLWDTVANTRHSARVIMDKYNLSKSEKDLLCAVIMAESGMNVKATNKNTNGSMDWGICQINDKYWIGEGKTFVSSDEVLNKPEKSIIFLVNAYKQGNLKWWYGYTNGSYKKFL